MDNQLLEAGSSLQGHHPGTTRDQLGSCLRLASARPELTPGMKRTSWTKHFIQAEPFPGVLCNIVPS